VGVRTSAGWTVVRGDALRDRQSVVIRSTERPEQVRLDPLETTEAVTRRFYAFPRASAGAGQPRPGG
jgi:hypothetical protein